MMNADRTGFGLGRICPALETRERGEDWKGPRLSLISNLESGLRYLPFENSLATISSNTSWCSPVEMLLGGVNMEDKEGKLAAKP